MNLTPEYNGSPILTLTPIPDPHPHPQSEANPDPDCQAHGVLEQCLGAEEAARVVQCRVRACQEDGSYPRYVQVALQRKGMEGDWAQLEYTKALEWCVQYTSAIVGFIGGPYNQEVAR